MLPSIHFFGIHISMYGLMMFLGAAAFFAMFFLMTKGEKLDGISKNRLIFFSICGIGVLYVSAALFDAIFHSIEEGEFVFGGITWLGGVVGAFPFMIFMLHKFVPCAKGRALEIFSLLIPGLVLGHALGRIGCFFGGCCYGKVTQSVFGVVFPSGSSAALQYPAADGRSLPVLPTQLFEAAFEAALFAVMMIFRKQLKYKNVQLYLVAYGVFRFALEFLRGDDRGSTGLFLSPAQLICIIIIVFGVLTELFVRGTIGKKLNSLRLDWQKDALIKVESLRKQDKDREGDPLETLETLYELKEKGAITEEEYNAKKAKILERL